MTLLPAEPDDQPVDDGVTRYEEELVAKTELVETQRVRLVKRVEVETVTRTVEVRREYLDVERIAIGATAPNAPETLAAEVPSPEDVRDSDLLAPGSFLDGVLEIVLMQEEVVISTRSVPRERIRLTKQVIAEERIVDADLRMERIDVERRTGDSETNDA